MSGLTPFTETGVTLQMYTKEFLHSIEARSKVSLEGMARLTECPKTRAFLAALLNLRRAYVELEKQQARDMAAEGEDGDD
jgi:hypothetical protein